ncbi:ABC transporter permease [Paenibacillus filicis]|uniref:ABC transporter permease n=1 Tax=Paenibacillus filicis TaxID=669464 RepID=A0ABU9DUT5_9BACL
MWQQTFSAEWLKLRRSRLGLVLAVLPVLSLLMGCANFVINQAVLQNGWYSLWTQVSLFYGEFFLPVLIAICCAYVCRLEHMNHNWNALLTAPVSPASVVLSKLGVVSVLIAGVQLLFVGLYVGAGLTLGLGNSLPPELPGWALRGWLASVAIGAVQLMLSMRIRSFAAPVGIALCAVFLGLGLYVAKLGYLSPYSLLTLGMGVLSQESLNVVENGAFMLMNMLFTAGFTALTVRGLRRGDVG